MIHLRWCESVDGRMEMKSHKKLFIAWAGLTTSLFFVRNDIVVQRNLNNEIALCAPPHPCHRPLFIIFLLKRRAGFFCSRSDLRLRIYKNIFRAMITTYFSRFIHIRSRKWEIAAVTRGISFIAVNRAWICCRTLESRVMQLLVRSWSIIFNNARRSMKFICMKSNLLLLENSQRIIVLLSREPKGELRDLFHHCR